MINNTAVLQFNISDLLLRIQREASASAAAKKKSARVIEI
jgi:hypothetical protein